VKNNQRKSPGNVGGARPGAGRPKGSLNKATADIKAAAQAYTEDALATLAQIMKAGESEAARVAAANSILDRGFGKPRQSMDLDATTDMTVEIVTGVPRAD
jgi:predicted ArsR family transcriptional regulator